MGIELAVEWSRMGSRMDKNGIERNRVESRMGSRIHATLHSYQGVMLKCHLVEIPFDARSQLIKIPQHHAVLNA